MNDFVVLFENQLATIDVKLIIFMWFDITLILKFNHLEVHNEA